MNRTRLRLLMIVSCAILALLVIRLFSQQVIRHGYYFALAQGQHVVSKSLEPQRGDIFVTDADGKLYPLATHETMWQVLVVPDQVVYPNRVVSQLTKFLRLSKKQGLQLLSQILAKKSYIPPLHNKKGITITLPLEEKAQLENKNLAGVIFIEKTKRIYPEGGLASQLVGYVDYAGKGNYGVEGYYDQLLRGQEGLSLQEKDSAGRLITAGLGQYKQPIDGASLVLTIDRSIQNKVEELLSQAVISHRADSGSIVVMDPYTGNIVALANYPTFDPNNYQKIRNYNWLDDAAIANAYEPGSAFKPISMAAAIDSGKVKPDTEGVFDSHVEIDKKIIKTSTGQAYGRENMTQVLEHSDNVAMVWVGQQMGKKIFYDYLQKFGIGVKIGMDVASEGMGYLKPVNKWLDIDAATMTFGQGISLTPLQLAMDYSVFANGGKLIKPKIVDRIIYPDGTERHISTEVIRPVISEDTANALTAMLISVVERGHGKQAGVKGYWVAGKTGTAQIPTPYGYDSSKTIGTFAGFFPADNPKYVMVVKIDVPRDVIWAESSAAPVFGQLASWLLANAAISPDRKDQVAAP